MSSRKDRYQEHLNRVSRSFAYTISKLEDPLYESVGMAYLICRILDTVEDAAWENFELQKKSFLEFNGFIESRPNDKEVIAWAFRIPKEIPEGERDLLKDAPQIFKDFHDSSPIDRDVIRPAVLSMSAGMMHFMGRKTSQGELKLNSLAEVNRYCFFVAGVVGDILTGLVRGHGPTLKLTPSEVQAVSIVDGIHFGLFLQKVNILKDQRTDEEEGRNLVPSRSLVKQSLTLDANRALEYILRIPARLKGYRTFCSAALFLGVASLPYIEESYREKSNEKIPRLKALSLFSRIERIIGDDQSLKDLYTELSRVQDAIVPLGENGSVENRRTPDRAGEKEVDELLSLYHGPVQRNDLNSFFNV